MERKIDPHLKNSSSLPGVKLALLSDHKPCHPGDCPNCGGLGVHTLFVAKFGPLKAPAGAYSGHTSKYFEGSWWAGKTISAPCPVCSANQPPRNIAPGADDA